MPGAGIEGRRASSLLPASSILVSSAMSIRRLPRPVSVQVLDGRFVSPSDFVDFDAKDGGDFLPLGRAGCPAAERNGRDAAVVEAAALSQLGDGDLLFLAEVGDGFDHGRERGARSGEQNAFLILLRAPCSSLLIRWLGNGLGFWHQFDADSLLAVVLKLYRILAVSIIPIDGI